MRYRFVYILFIFCFFATGLVSCLKEKDEAASLEERKVSIAGNWVVSEFNNDLTVYGRSATLKPNEFGYVFMNGGRLIVRGSANSTDTLLSREYEGSWNMENGILTINANYWGGRMIEKWVIIYLSNTTLTTKKISDEFPQ